MWNTKQKGERMSGEKFRNGAIYNSTGGTTLGKIKGDRIYNSTGGTTLGIVRGEKIYNHTGGTTLGIVRGDRVYNHTGGTTLGYVRDFTIQGMENESPVLMVAAYHFLVKKIF